MFDTSDVRVLEHGKDTCTLFGLIGEFFASPSFRQLFGRPMASLPGDVWLVWVVEGQVQGFAALRIKPGNKGELCHAWTAEKHRRKGFNTYSVRRRIELARARGIKTLHTIIKPSRAERYEALGFVMQTIRGQYTTYTLRPV